jgi:hypothetical protein
MNPILDFSERVTVLPVVNGSAEFSREVRKRLARAKSDCLAVALPPSFAAPVEEAVGLLPQISVVVQNEASPDGSCNYVPVDPCQAVIAAIREAIEADMDLAYLDLEVAVYEPETVAIPDPYALVKLPLEKFLTALVATLPAPQGDQRLRRIARMAYELHVLELEYERITLVCSAADWPWIRTAYLERLNFEDHEVGAGMPRMFRAAMESLCFVLGELPFITQIYEHRRAELLDDESQSIDGVKSLLLRARECLSEDRERLTPQRLSQLLAYLRNLTVMDGRLAPDLYNLAVAAKQVVDDDFALAVVEASREYPVQLLPSDLGEVRMGHDKLVDADGSVRICKNRLEGVPRVWRKLPLRPTPPPPKRRNWELQWDPFTQCSYPPEDDRIENFQQHVREQAKLLMGEDLARTEKFTSSLKDGLDVRESLRNWHTGDLYVREIPATTGNVEVVVFIFDTPADGETYSWRGTWFAEHKEESTLAFYATPFRDTLVGPGIGQARYGGCFFMFPPRPIPDIWRDPRFRHAKSLEEHLLAAAFLHSRERRVVLVSPVPPRSRWRHLARQSKRQLVYLPLKRFSGATIERLRRFHVLNGKAVRSYAARYIRR